MKKTERVCQFYKLAIIKEGDIFPCCIHEKKTRLGNIFDEDIIEKIKTTNINCECGLYKTKPIAPGDKMDIQRLHIMFSNACQAKCVCCFQEHKDDIPKEKEYLEKLSYFIEKFNPKYITVFGGEVLIQPKTLCWIENIKKLHPEISFDIITNLCVGENIIKRAEKIFDDITISFLGFTPNTYQNIMGLDFNTTIKNFNYLQSNTTVKLRPKYLTMPTNVYELPLFLKWALEQKTEKIYLHNISEFSDCCNLKNSFWQKTFKQVEAQIKKILSDKRDYIISQNKHFISLHQLTGKVLNIDDDYIKNNGFENIIKIT